MEYEKARKVFKQIVRKEIPKPDWWAKFTTEARKLNSDICTKHLAEGTYETFHKDFFLQKVNKDLQPENMIFQKSIITLFGEYYEK